MKCDYCGGRGKYDPFTGPTETCPKCGGSGEANGIVTADPEHSVVGTFCASVLRAAAFLALAQRWDANQFGLTAGKFYMHNCQSPKGQPIEMGQNLILDINNMVEHVYRVEFPSKGFKLVTSDMAEYDQTAKEHGTNPCIEHGTLFLCNGGPGYANVGFYEFFASDETMGLSFGEQLKQYVGQSCVIKAHYEAAICLYRPGF